MDPNETLKILRYHVAEFQRIYDESGQYDKANRDGADNKLIDTGDTIAEAFAALDGWLASGGFQPKWAKD